MKSIFTLFILVSYISISYGQNQVKGKAFIDQNSNGIRDRGEDPVDGLYISNGRDIVSTDKKGNYRIEKLDGRFIFAIKPAGFQFPLDKDFQARFYQPDDAKTFNIPLLRTDEDARFSLVLMGDPQVYAQDQINYLGEVATDELIGADYEFLIALGDLVGNVLPLMPDVKTTLGLTQKVCYYAIGNHDRDRGDFPDPAAQDNDSFEKTFGPDYYSFNWGNVHFLVLNNILTVKPGELGNSDYYPGLHPLQAEFVENDLKRVPPEKLVVVAAHIPFVFDERKTNQTKQILALLSNHPQVFIATGHSHNQFQVFFDENDGWNHEQPVRELVAGAICGGWWRGEPDMFGIPGSMMRDGTPRGYWFMHIDGSDYQLEYKASGMDRNKQMHIWVPSFKDMDTLFNPDKENREVRINVYAGNELTNVKMRIDSGEWQSTERKEEFDPYILHLLERQETGWSPSEGSRPLKTGARPSTHLWYGRIPEGIPTGAHTIEVSARNNSGLDATAYRVFWIKE